MSVTHPRQGPGDRPELHRCAGVTCTRTVLRRGARGAPEGVGATAKGSGPCPGALEHRQAPGEKSRAPPAFYHLGITTKYDLVKGLTHSTLDTAGECKNLFSTD